MFAAKRKGINCSACPLGIRSNRLKLHQGRFGLDIRKRFIIVRRESAITDCLKSPRNLHRWRPLSEGCRNTPQQWVRADPAPRHILTSSGPFHFGLLGSFFFFGSLTEEEGNCTQHLKQQNIYSFYATKHTVNKSNYVYDLLMAPLMS